MKTFITKLRNLLKPQLRKWRYVHAGEKGPQILTVSYRMWSPSALWWLLTTWFVTFIHVWIPRCKLVPRAQLQGDCPSVGKSHFPVEVDPSFGQLLKHRWKWGFRSQGTLVWWKETWELPQKEEDRNSSFNEKKAYLGELTARWQENGNNFKAMTGKD